MVMMSASVIFSVCSGQWPYIKWTGILPYFWSCLLFWRIGLSISIMQHYFMSLVLKLNAVCDNYSNFFHMRFTHKSDISGHGLWMVNHHVEIGKRLFRSHRWNSLSDRTILFFPFANESVGSFFPFDRCRFKRLLHNLNLCKGRFCAVRVTPKQSVLKAHRGELLRRFDPSLECHEINVIESAGLIAIYFWSVVMRTFFLSVRAPLYPWTSFLF